MTPNPSAARRAIDLCRREGLSYAGVRSARLAVLYYRLTIRCSFLRSIGRPFEHRIPRVGRIAQSYLRALAADRSTTPSV